MGGGGRRLVSANSIKRQGRTQQHTLPSAHSTDGAEPAKQEELFKHCRDELLTAHNEDGNSLRTVFLTMTGLPVAG